VTAASVWPSSSARRSLAAFLVLVAVIGCAVLTAAAPPPPPAACYGDLTVNGDPAPEGLTITAEIDRGDSWIADHESDGRLRRPRRI